MVRQGIKCEIESDAFSVGAINDLIPLLNPEQREMILDCIFFIRYIDKGVLYNYGDTEDLYSYILIEGEMHIFNKKNTLIDIVSGMSFFGYQGPIFKRRTHTIYIEKDSIVGFIKREDFLKILMPFSKFSKSGAQLFSAVSS